MYNLPIGNIAVNLCELNEKIKFAQRNGFKFNQINKITIKIYARQSQMSISYHLKHRIAKMHREFFRKKSQIKEFSQNFWTNFNILFEYACHQ